MIRNFIFFQRVLSSFIWVFAVLYCVLCFAISCQQFFQYFEDDFNDFTIGLSFLSNKRDKSDLEWETTTYLLYSYLPWLIVYLIVEEIIKQQCLSFKVQQIWQILFVAFFFYLGGFQNYLILLVLQPIFFYFGKLWGLKDLWTWIFSSVSLLFIIAFNKFILNSHYPSQIEYQIHLLHVSLCWINLKCTSFYLEHNGAADFLSLISYCFYPPTLFNGPFILYADFKNVYIHNKNFKSKTGKLFKNLMKCFLWHLLGNFCLHYVYVSATSFQPQFVEKLDYVSLCGYGYAMGQFFHIKYLVLYGFSTAVASFDNVIVPSLPRCIGRTHLYSDMWRYFDPGLYSFLKRNIYLPSLKKMHYKFIASMLCFCFICCWHGPEDYIIIWTVMNYIGIIVEHISSNVYKSYLSSRLSIIGPTAVGIIANIAASPLLAFSAISNFYFFGGTKVGNIFLKRLFGNVFDSFRLLLILFCCCQVSTDLKKINASKMQ